MSRTSAIAASVLILAAMPLRGEPLGRLFFTPEQRALLDRQRLRNQHAVPGNAPDAAAYSLDGQVHRSSGRDTRPGRLSGGRAIPRSSSPVMSPSIWTAVTIRV